MESSTRFYCEYCGDPVTQSSIRTFYLGGRKVLACKLCFLKLPEKDRADSKRQTKLVHKVEYAQGELPF